MKSHSIRYVQVVVVVTAAFLFFITSKYWMPTDRDIRDENYDTVFEMDCWTMKINNAVYNKKEETLSFDWYQFSKITGATAPDFVIYNGRKSTQKKPLKYQIYDTKVPDKADQTKEIIAKHIVVENVPKNYWYVSVNFSCIPHYADTSAETYQLDIFGFENKIEKADPTPTEKKVQMDYRNVKNEVN